ADLDGSVPPPAGSPGYFVSLYSGSTPTDRLFLWKFHVDWLNSANTTISDPPLTIFTSQYDPTINGIPQPSATPLLETLSNKPMFRVAYRNFGDHESLAVNHTVDVGSEHGGVRWYEIRNPNGSPTNPPFAYQQSSYAPDASHRWMGSIAMDHAGDMAL